MTEEDYQTPRRHDYWYHATRIESRLDKIEQDLSHMDQRDKDLAEQQRRMTAMADEMRALQLESSKQLDTVWKDLQESLEIFRAARGAYRVGIWVARGVAVLAGAIAGSIALWQTFKSFKWG